MAQRTNDLGQPIGAALPGFAGCPPPPRTPMEGRYCRLEPLDADRHAASLYEANAADAEGRMWTYLPIGPFDAPGPYRTWVEEASRSADPLFHAVVGLPAGTAIGVASYLRITPAAGVIEIGHIAYSPLLQRTPAATEAMMLMMARAFEALGYRRYEWKCDSLNAPSRAAAERLGFTFEGIFRQATVYKGRNRDTAWYSILDGEWPALKAAYAEWLDPANFDADGRQRSRLSDLTRAALESVRGG